MTTVSVRCVEVDSGRTANLNYTGPAEAKQSIGAEELSRLLLQECTKWQWVSEHARVHTDATIAVNVYDAPNQTDIATKHILPLAGHYTAWPVTCILATRINHGHALLLLGWIRLEPGPTYNQRKMPQLRRKGVSCDHLLVSVQTRAMQPALTIQTSTLSEEWQSSVVISSFGLPGSPLPAAFSASKKRSRPDDADEPAPRSLPLVRPLSVTKTAAERRAIYCQQITKAWESELLLHARLSSVETCPGTLLSDLTPGKMIQQMLIGLHAPQHITLATLAALAYYLVPYTTWSEAQVGQLVNQCLPHRLVALVRPWDETVETPPPMFAKSWHALVAEHVIRWFMRTLFPFALESTIDLIANVEQAILAMEEGNADEDDDDDDNNNGKVDETRAEQVQQACRFDALYNGIDFAVKHFKALYSLRLPASPPATPPCALLGHELDTQTRPSVLLLQRLASYPLGGVIVPTRVPIPVAPRFKQASCSQAGAKVVECDMAMAPRCLRALYDEMRSTGKLKYDKMYTFVTSIFNFFWYQSETPNDATESTLAWFEVQGSPLISPQQAHGSVQRDGFQCKGYQLVQKMQKLASRPDQPNAQSIGERPSVLNSSCTPLITGVRKKDKIGCEVQCPYRAELAEQRKKQDQPPVTDLEDLDTMCRYMCMVEMHNQASNVRSPPSSPSRAWRHLSIVCEKD